MLKKIIRAILNELKGHFEFFIVYAPRTHLGYLVRKLYWGRILKIKTNLQIDRGSVIVNSQLIEIGDNFIVGENVCINAGECKGIYIGNNVWISKGSYLRSANHNFDRIDIPMKEQGHKCASIDYNNREYSIVVENDCWIASNSTILSGAFIGEGSVISTGTVVSGKIPPYSIVMGNPGRIIGNRKKNLEK